MAEVAAGAVVATPVSVAAAEVAPVPPEAVPETLAFTQDASDEV